MPALLCMIAVFVFIYGLLMIWVWFSECLDKVPYEERDEDFYRFQSWVNLDFLFDSGIPDQYNKRKIWTNNLKQIQKLQKEKQSRD